MRDLFDNIRREIKGKPLEYSVGVVGLGNLGSATLGELWRIDRVTKTYLITTNVEKGLGLKMDNTDERAFEVDKPIVHYNDLPEVLDEIDILIITVAKSGYLDKRPLQTREEQLQDNLPIW